MNKADSKALFAQLHEAIGQIAAVREEARARGLEMPEHVKAMIRRMRLQLLQSGLSPQQIDSTPGLEPVD